MLRDHTRIAELLDKIKSGTNSADRFEAFKWELEKHLFLEEKAIFKIVEEDSAIYPSVQKLLEEHDTILKMVKTIESVLKTEGRIQMGGFQSILEKHRYYEDDFLYPILDEKLDSEHKQEIMHRLRKLEEDYDGTKTND